MTNTNDKPATRRDVARTFGMLEPQASLDDLETERQRAGDVKGGSVATPSRVTAAEIDVHGCPACPHPPNVKTILPR